MMTETQGQERSSNVTTITHTTVGNPTTVTVKTEPGQGGVQWLKFNPAYFATLPGILLLVQALLGIICMALASPAYHSGTHWFLFVVVICFIITVILIFLYLLSIRDALKLPIDWNSLEFYYTAGATLLYVIAFIVQLAVWAPFETYNHYYLNQIKSKNIAAGVIGIFNFAAYGIGAFFLYKRLRESRVN